MVGYPSPSRAKDSQHVRLILDAVRNSYNRRTCIHELEDSTARWLLIHRDSAVHTCEAVHDAMVVPMSPEDGNEVFVGVTAVQVQGLPSLSCYRYLHATKPHVTSTVFDRDAQRPGLAKHWHMRTHIHILHGARYTGRGRALACASNTRCWSSMGLNMRL